MYRAVEGPTTKQANERGGDVLLTLLSDGSDQSCRKVRLHDSCLVGCGNGGEDPMVFVLVLYCIGSIQYLLF